MDYLSVIDDKRQLLEDTANYLWDNPELAFTEFRSAEYLRNVLRAEGFAVEDNLAGIATAFSGRYGSGRPYIGILGEFDALSGLSQEACATQYHPLGGEAGHGCGHNLLGTAALGAALAVKAWLEQTGHAGTVIYYGCPGEEGGSGKGFMARDGVFNELDAALTWHPGDETKVRNQLSLSNYQILYRFNGIASHAGAKPELGRSALDALELMNIGVQFLREHIPSSCRIHYAITDTGGPSPNVVQPHAEVLYLLRGVNNQVTAELYDRVNDIAKGAALMTGTTESHDFIKACSNLVPNDAIQRMLQEKMEQLLPPEPTGEELEYARRLIIETMANNPDADPDTPIHWRVQPYSPMEQKHGSTDVGDVSWVCPTAQFYAATCAKGTPGHSWQMTAQGRSSYAHRMTAYAAKVLAAGAVELLENQTLLEQAEAEFRKRTGPRGYVPPIPEGVQPRSISELVR